MNLKRQLFAALIGTVTLFAGFKNVDCNNQSHLDTLKLPKVECEVLDAFWDAMGNGAGWKDKTGWDTVSYAGEWSGVHMYDDNSSIWAFAPSELNLTGSIPPELKNFTALQILAIWGNNINGHIPAELFQIKTLNSIGVGRNNLSGPIPDMSALPHLTYIDISNNHFTFADIEPQAAYIKQADDYAIAPQEPIDESKNAIVYFNETLPLRIEPSLPLNPSGHDHYVWSKDGTRIQDTHTYVDGNYTASRIYIKEHPTPEDAGLYSYDVTNDVVNVIDINSNHALHLKNSQPIQAIYDRPPVVSNTPNAQVTIEAQTLYSYTPDATDADSDTLAYSIAEKPSWANFDTATGELSGTPANEDAGSYDINITVTDGKMPVTIAYTLTVTPKDILPASITAPVNNGYTHKITHNTMLTALTPRLSAHWDSTNERFFFREKENCTAAQAAYIALDSSGALLSGYEECNNQTLTATLDTASSYPEGSKATLLTQPGTTDAMIMVEIPLTSSITIGE